MSANIKLPQAREHARIGVLGGSFDPPHLGHTLLGLSFLSLEPIDELWVIPCANHANKNILSDFSHRFSLCHIAFSRIKNVHVLDIEQHLPAPNYTIQTIDYIKDKRPDLELYLALGSDLLSGFDSWCRPQEIIAKTKMVIFERTGFAMNIPASLHKAHVHQGYALPDTTSSSVRDFLAQKKPLGPEPLLDSHVLDYIRQHKLYC